MAIYAFICSLIFIKLDDQAFEEYDVVEEIKKNITLQRK